MHSPSNFGALARLLETLDDIHARKQNELFADDYRCTYYSRDGAPPVVTDRYGRKVGEMSDATKGRWIHAKWPGRCENFADCGNHIVPGDRMYFRDHLTYCESCGELEEDERK